MPSRVRRPASSTAGSARSASSLRSCSISSAAPPRLRSAALYSSTSPRSSTAWRTSISSPTSSFQAAVAARISLLADSTVPRTFGSTAASTRRRWNPRYEGTPARSSAARSTAAAFATRLLGSTRVTVPDRRADEDPQRDEQRSADGAGEHDRDAERGARHAGDPHGFGRLLGVLEVTVRGLHLGDRDRVLTAFVPAEPAERHLDPLHLVGGGQEPVGGPPQRSLVEQAQLADHQVGGRRELGDRQRLQAPVELVAVRERIGERVDERMQLGRRRLGEGGGPGQVGGGQAGGGPEPVEHERQRVGGFDPRRGQRSRRVPMGEQVPVGVRAARARLQGRGLGSDALEAGQDLGVLAAVGALVGGPQRLVELVELLLQRRRALGLAEGGLQLLGDLLEGVAGLAQLPGLVLAPASA